MAQNEFTKANKDTGLPPNVILEAGLNVFALDLIAESFSKLAGKDTKPVEFTYRGVNMRLQVSDKAI